MPDEIQDEHAREQVQALRAAVRHLSQVMDRTLEGYEEFGQAGVEIVGGGGELSVVLPAGYNKGSQGFKVSIIIVGGSPTVAAD